MYVDSNLEIRRRFIGALRFKNDIALRIAEGCGKALQRPKPIAVLVISRLKKGNVPFSAQRLTVVCLITGHRVLLSTLFICVDPYDTHITPKSLLTPYN